MNVILEGNLVLGAPADGPAAERHTVVRFRDADGKAVLEIRTTAAVEVADPDGVVFAIDAAGNVEA
jgi:hypothetical protein